MHPLLLFEVIQAELKERRRHSEEQRLIRMATMQQPKPHERVLEALSGLLIATGQRIQASSQFNPRLNQGCCVSCTC